MAASISFSLAKNVIFNLCKPFPNASPSPFPSLKYSTNISTLSFTTSASKQPWDGRGVDANRDPRPDLAFEDANERAKEGTQEMKEKAKDYAEEGTNKARAAKEKVKDYAHDAKEKAKEGTNRAEETVELVTERSKEGAKGVKEKTEDMAKEATEKAKQTVQGAWEAAKDTTQKIKETVMGSNEEEKGKVMDEDVVDLRTKTRTKFDD